MKVRLLLLMLLMSLCVCAQENLPCLGITTTNVNVRKGPGTHYKSLGVLSKGSNVKVISTSNPKWAYVEYGNNSSSKYKSSYENTTKKGYIYRQYLKLAVKKDSDSSTNISKKASDSDWWSFSFLDVVWFIVGVLIYYAIALVCFNVVARILYILLRFVKTVSMFYYILNWLQRFVQKPWYWLLRTNIFSDETNKILRIVSTIVKIPLYVLCTPLRFINALFYNMVIHCSFEIYNYTLEVLYPSNNDEGADEPRAIHFFVWRILKYPIWHGTLTFIECMAWTAIDTILPALTLYHGTSYGATANIVSTPSWHSKGYYDVGVWIVGAGNYAGNGIYFASALSTAEHYSGGNAIIVCRVTLGRILDLGLAPNYVYRECGHPDALNATRWGLNNGYTTGEWWRGDEGWWEFCMYDWQNRYNESWRIRPLYIMDASTKNIERMPGGMHHWLFRWMVVKDIVISTFNTIKKTIISILDA